MITATVTGRRGADMLDRVGANFKISSMRDKVTPEEWQARIDLAACYRLVAHYEMTDMLANHISARVPGEPNAFLINPYGMMYEEITASSLIKIDHDGNILAKPDFGDLDYGINLAGYVIHSAIHRARKEVDCVLHTHTWAGMAVSILECGLIPNTQTSMRFAKIAYHDYWGPATNPEEQESLVADLGDLNAMIMRNHGLLTVGRSIAEAFNTMHRLELSCKTQLAAMATGQKLVYTSNEIVEKTYQMYQPNNRRVFGVMEWPALLRHLDRMDPSYRD
jgi:ribulose-5-phosphate 4-epimerase/fuculose-1-phosphate aldolase